MSNPLFGTSHNMVRLRVLADESPSAPERTLGAPAVVEPDGGSNHAVTEAVAVLELPDLGHGIARTQLHAFIGEPVGDRGDHPVKHHQIEVKHCFPPSGVMVRRNILI